MDTRRLDPAQERVANFGGPPDRGEDLWVPDMGTIEVVYDANREMWHWRYTFPGSGATVSAWAHTDEDAVGCAQLEMNGVRRLWQNEIVRYQDHGDRDSSGRLVIRAEGHQYTIEADRPRGQHAGFGGREFRFRMLETDEVIVSHNAWSGGEVPNQIRHLLPDNAEFLRG